MFCLEGHRRKKGERDTGDRIIGRIRLKQSYRQQMWSVAHIRHVKQ